MSNASMSDDQEFSDSPKSFQSQLEQDLYFRNEELKIKVREQNTRDDELALKREEYKQALWRSPLMIAIIAGAIAAGANIYTTSQDAIQMTNLEREKAEYARVLEMIKTSDRKTASDNVRFLIQAGLVTTPEIVKQMNSFFAASDSCSGPVLPTTSAQLADGRSSISASCTLRFYKPDVTSFSTSTANLVSLFKKLIDIDVTNETNDRMKSIEKSHIRLVMDPDCYNMDNIISEHIHCLISWRAFRRNQYVLAKPSCPEPMPFASILPDLKQCSVGKMKDNNFEAMPLATAQSENHIRIANAIDDYATQLSAIVSAANDDQLETAVADAGVALQALWDEFPGVYSSARGPEIRAGLGLALEARRFELLMSVVKAADPVIQQASGELSIFANVLYYLDVLQPAFRAYDDAVLRVVPEPSSTFLARVEEATARERAYPAAIAVTPGDVFKGVADAHHGLRSALEDPTQQIYVLRRSINILNTKTSSLADALKR